MREIFIRETGQVRWKQHVNIIFICANIIFICSNIILIRNTIFVT